MNNKEYFFATIEEFETITGISTSYEKQGSNGKYLFFETPDDENVLIY